MKHFIITPIAMLVVGGVLLCCSTPAQAQEPQGYAGAGKLLLNKAVQDELQLSGEQLQKTGQVLRDIGNKFKGSAAALAKLSVGERFMKYNQLIDEANAETFKGLKDILDAKQMTRLRQFDRREQGPRALRDPDVLKQLKLSEEQQAKLTQIGLASVKEVGEFLKVNAINRSDAAKKVAAAQQRTLDDIVKLFTDDQQKVWQQLIGKPDTSEPALREPENTKATNARQPAESSTVATTGRINALLQVAWHAGQIVPAPTVDDAGFARRASLDLTGTLPTPEGVQAFVTDRSADKRARLVDELLSSEASAARWADYWNAILMGRLTREAFIDRNGFEKWLKSEFTANTRWDAFVTKLITAEGYNTNRRPKGATDDPPDIDARHNPAVNWFLRYFQAIPELSAATTKTFLGVQLQCAQCHDHKTEKWKQTDFNQFTAFYTRTWPAYYDKTLVVGTTRVELKDRLTAPPAGEKFQQYFGSYQPYAATTPKVLAGAELAHFKPRRTELANWITSKENPWFAKAFVNRMWATLLGRGFVEPIDDFRDSNPALVPEALDVLAKDFADSGFDVRHLLRTICLTEAYQRACVTGASPADAPKLWAAYPVKPLDVEPLFAVALQATGADSLFSKLTKGNVELIRSAWVRQFVTHMGTDDKAEVADAETTIAKMLASLNGTLFNSTSQAAEGLALPTILKQYRSEAERLDQLYLRTLSRLPTDAERRAWSTFLSEPRKLGSSPAPASQQLAQRSLLGGGSSMMARAGNDADFRTLAAQARTAADFKELAGQMRNNADAGLYVKAFEEWAAEEPFRYLVSVAGARTAHDQAWEDVLWSLLNSTEFVTNH